MFTMDCRMTRGIYLRANGEINCYCSTGEQITVAQLPLDHLDFNFVDDFYYRGNFQHIRDCMNDHKLPFPVYCLKCNYLNPFGQFEREKVRTEIEWFHIEAMSACNLKCPFCVHGIPAEKRSFIRKGPSKLPVPLYNKVLQDIADAGLRLKWMYFSGRGEPGLHPQVWDMVKTAKTLFDTNFLVNTAGNIPYDDKIVDSGLDKIKIAFESLDQETYSRYRVGGHVEIPLELTRKIADRKTRVRSKTPEIIWQYVLFNFNDSDEELINYQVKALEYGVDRLRVIHTWTKNFSTRKPDDFPRIFPNIEFIDCYERGYGIPLNVLQTELDNALQTNNIRHYISLIARIFHWLEWDTENRDEYDHFATLSLCDDEIFKRRNDGNMVEGYKSILKRCLLELSNAYRQNGFAGESQRYLKFAEEIH